MKKLWTRIQRWYTETDDYDFKLNLFNVLFWGVVFGIILATLAVVT